jgi:hypothetical protein
MKTYLTMLLAFFVLQQCASAQKPNQLSKKEEKDGWKLLFDGTTTTGWHAYLKKDAGTAWKAAGGSLQLDPKAEGASDLVTDAEYENFDLQVEWNIAEGGNSGIIFGIHEDPKYSETYFTGIEMQVLDNIKAEDNKKANHLAGSLYDMFAPLANVVKPAGQWNLARIQKQNGHIIFWLNGTKIVETQIGSPEWTAAIDNSKYKTWKAFAMYPLGHISLQGHGAQVMYRSIKIKQL